MTPAFITLLFLVLMDQCQCLNVSTSEEVYLQPAHARSVTFSCGGTQCPSGQDCLLVDGTSHCMDPCDHYTPIDDAWRATDNRERSHCDQSEMGGPVWQGWYRLFLGNSSVQMPERCTEFVTCGASGGTLWLKTPHPLPSEGIIEAQVCGSASGARPYTTKCCFYETNPIHVKVCPRNYYVYKFIKLTGFCQTYCADVNTLVCNNCTEAQTCVSDDKINWRCEEISSPAPTPSLSVRLIGSGSSCSGRVEVFHNGQWGTVCDRGLDKSEAEVVCRQVGCGRALEAHGRAHFGQGNGHIWLADLYCSGNESSLTDCAHPGLGNTQTCGHEEDAGVICEAPSSTVRLVGSNSSCSGRVEVLHDGQWGTVCDDHWDLSDAEVVCRQVGCGRALYALQEARHGQGSGPIWLDDVHCSGTESSLTYCRHRGLGRHNCVHREDAGVICEEISSSVSTTTPVPTPPAPTPPSSPVRLVNSSSNCSGRVEVFHNGQWGTVCDNVWDLSDAEVVCRQVGCGRALEAPQGARHGQGSGPIWLDSFQCSGTESSLTDCLLAKGTPYCEHHQDAGVICEEIGSSVSTTTPAPTPTTPPGSPVRLVGSSSNCSGRVEVFHDGQWGTVCYDSWDKSDANVVCRQVGCGRARSALGRAPYGPGSGPIWLDDLQCSGNESSLTDCRHLGLGRHNCRHQEDAGVICEDDPQCSGTEPSPHCANPGLDSNNCGHLEGGGLFCEVEDHTLVCNYCTAGQTCVSNDTINWRCEESSTRDLTTSPTETSTTEMTTSPTDEPSSLGPELVCGREQMLLTVPKGILEEQGLNGSSAHLVDPRCHQQLDGQETFSYLVERREVCGNVVKNNGTHVTYSNTVFVYPSNRSDTSLSVPRCFPFSCNFPLDDITSLDAAISFQPPPCQSGGEGVVGSGDPTSASVTLYTRSDFSEAFPAGPVRLPLGSALHVGVSVNNTEYDGFGLLLETCYFTNSPNASDPLKHFLIENRCAVDRRHVKVIESGASLRARFSALLFLYHGTYEDVYLHCSISMCDRSSAPCSPNCSRRQARSAVSSDQLAVAVGPISWF